MAESIVIVREYRSSQEYQKDAGRLAEQGYEVVSTADRPQRSGCMRLLLTGGLGFFLWKPKPVIAVTYRLRRN